MTSNERQKKIIRLLDKRRKDTMEHLSIEFHVSTDTISRDIATLNEDYTQYLCCTAGNSDPMTLRIKEALAAAPPCDTFDSKLYHTIADKIVLHRTTSIQLKLINGMVV